MSNKQPTSMDELLEEFEFEVEGVPTPKPVDGITIAMGTEEEKEAARLAAIEEAKNAPPTTEEEEETARLAAIEAAKKAPPVKTEEELAAEAIALEEAAKSAKQGNNSGYKEIALKYIEKGNWSADLAIEDGEGNVVPISELEEIDEETFFQIEEAVKKQDAEDNKDKFISVEGVEERRRTIIDIVKAGGDLTQIFSNASEVEDYVNPFSTIDLDNESVQERVYLNALIKHNKLDEDTAQTVVDKAKKDLTLDTKVKAYIDQYTESFDKYVEAKKQEILTSKKEETKAAKEFKKSLKEQYKSFDIKDSLANKLADSAINKKDGEFEIDSVYAQRMENPEEAAELILFLTDKKAYLDFKMKDSSLAQHKKTRQVIKLIPREKIPTKKEGDDDLNKSSEFEFEVPVNK